MIDFKQQYKDRAEAYRDFVMPLKLPVKRAKFYDDCLQLKIVNTDKSINLSDLLAYVKTELKIDPISGKNLGEKSFDLEMAEIDFRIKKAEAEGKERKNQRETGQLMDKAEHEIQMAAFAGRIEEALRQAVSLKLMELVHVAAGDLAKASDLNDALEMLHSEALGESVRVHIQTLTFEVEEGDGEEPLKIESDIECHVDSCKL